MPKVLLHICCGICASYCIEKLQQEGFNVTGLFYNPNIQPQDEYERRLKAARAVAEYFSIPLIHAACDCRNWQERVKGLEKEPEGGKRCLLCFRMRLEYAGDKCAELGMDYFASTLSISPHKDTQAINQAGSAIDPARFKGYDFKKEGGFKKAADFARAHKLYRQNYCGCLSSIKIGSSNLSRGKKL